MIVEERMRTYINSLDMGNTPFLEELEKKALAGKVPIIRKEMQSFLKMFLAATRPMKILEVGTAVGFSTLLMCEYGPENLKITTIENYEKRIPIARENFRKAGRESQIEFLTGDAGEILKELTGTYDLIFMDAAKGQYMNWLPDVLRLMHKGSVLVSDNVLQEGDIIESHYLVERRNRTIYKRMRQYLYELKHNPLLETSINGAHGVLINVTGSMDIGLDEVEQAASLVQEAVHPDALTIFGATFDETLDDEIRVTVIATGFEEVEGAMPNKPFSAAAERRPRPSLRLRRPRAPAEEDPFEDIFKIFNRGK